MGRYYFITFRFLTWYYRREINKKANDNYAMESVYNNKATVIGNINSADVKYKVDVVKGTLVILEIIILQAVIIVAVLVIFKMVT